MEGYLHQFAPKETEEFYIDVCLRRIIRSGSEMARATGGVEEAARQLKLPHLTKLTENMSFIESTRNLYPEIAAESMCIYANGDSPKYEETPAKASPDDGYPIDIRSLQKII